jgi:hypothetical protein
MTGTLAVTAGRGEAGLGRAAPGPRRYAPEIAGAGPWPGWGGAGPGREGFIPARRASRYPGFLFRRIYPRKKYADRRYKRFPGYYGGYYDEDGTIRRYRDLESPAARHETRRIGKAADMAAAGSCDGRFGMITAMTMTRANRAAEAKAVAELAPFPKTGLRSHRYRQPHGPGALGQPERHETPDPVRSDAVESRFHGVRQRAGQYYETTLT